MLFRILIFLLMCFAPLFAEDEDDDKKEMRKKARGMSGKELKKFSVGGKTSSGGSESSQLITDAPIDDTKYIVGPGDRLQINLGRVETFTIGPSGYLQMDDVPLIDLRGLTFAESKMKIKRELVSLYDTVKVHISLSRLKKFKIFLRGEVRQPGSAVISPFTRLLDLIQTSGGFTETAVRQKAEITSFDGSTKEIELTPRPGAEPDEFNPVIKFGDVITIKAVDFQESYCEIKQDGIIYFYQVDGKTDLRSVLFEISSYSKNFVPELVLVNQDGGKKLSLDKAAGSKYIPSGGDKIEILSHQYSVFVGGAVVIPTRYDYDPNFTAEDYMFSAGIDFQSNRSLDYKVYRAGAELSKSKVEETGILPGDKIYIRKSNFHIANSYITTIASISGIIISGLTLFILLK